MAGIIFKILSTLTAFCPALIIFGLKNLYEWSIEEGCWYLIAGLLGIGLHGLMIRSIRSKLPDLELTITEITPADKKLFAYVIGYLIPILEGSFIGGGLLIVIASLLFIIVAYSNATAYNPVYFLYRFHYYDIKDGQAVDKSIISKSALFNTKDKLTVKALSPYQYLKF